MIFYDWKKIYSYSKGSTREILKILRYITFKPLIVDYDDDYYNISQMSWKGNSFLLNPEALFYYRYKHKDREIAEYVGLASLRSYAEYKALNTKTLNILACKGKDKLIDNNSLLYIKNNEVHFLYEEAI